MPVPSNQSFATATDIGALSGFTAYTTTQDPFDGLTVVADLYYSYLPVVGDDMLEVYAYGQASPLYRPETTIWTGPLGSEALISGFATSTPMQQDIVTNVVAGERVFFKFHRVSTDAGVSVTLTIRIRRAEKQTALAGDLFINDSTQYFPGIVMDPTTAIPKRFILNYPAGEGQQVLTNGIICVLDAFDVEGPVIYDTDFTVRATPTMPDAEYKDALGSNQVTHFWALRNVGAQNTFAITFDEDGNTEGPYNLGASSYSDVTAQADNGAIYCIRGTEIRKITIPGLVVTTFLTVTSEANILMMTDDTLLVAIDDGGTLKVQQYNLSASLLTSTTITGVTPSTLERIFADDEDPDYFWVWWQTSTHNRFQKYAIGNATAVVDLSRMKFVEGISEEGVVIGSTIYSGADFSCVPIVLRAEGSVVTNSGRRGIYVPTRGVAGSEGGGANVRFQDLDGRIIPVVDAPRTMYVPSHAESSGAAVPFASLDTARVIPVPTRKRAIYVPTVGIAGAEGDGRSSSGATVGIRRVVVYDGEGYTHR